MVKRKPAVRELMRDVAWLPRVKILELDWYWTPLAEGRAVFPDCWAAGSVNHTVMLDMLDVVEGAGAKRLTPELYGFMKIPYGISYVG
jgi:hypothetical protein